MHWPYTRLQKEFPPHIPYTGSNEVARRSVHVCLISAVNVVLSHNAPRTFAQLQLFTHDPLTCILRVRVTVGVCLCVNVFVLKWHEISPLRLNQAHKLLNNRTE